MCTRKVPAFVAIIIIVFATLGMRKTCAANTITINFTTFPDGTSIPLNLNGEYGLPGTTTISRVSDEFESLGLLFISPPGLPVILGAPPSCELCGVPPVGGVLVSSDPFFFGDILMEFVVPVASITLEIIGSGLNISASLEAFNSDGSSLGMLTHTYTGPTGQLSSFTFLAPAGETITSALYNGGLNPNAAALIGTLIFTTAPQSVDIEIKPGSDDNCINNDGHGVIPVAILSSAEFDATTVDPITVSLDGQSVRVRGNGQPQASIEDVNGDGLNDLKMQIEDLDGSFQEGSTTATLTGATDTGLMIQGTDTICIVP